MNHPFPKSEAPTELVYGPIPSRRFGLSIGINPLGDAKICSFDCVYCNLGPTTIKMNQVKKDIVFAQPQDFVEPLRAMIRELITKDTPPQALTISGHGEPTLYPQFDELVKVILSVRDEISSGLPVLVLTNGAHLDSKRVVAGLDRVDKTFLKLDAGNENLFRSLNQPLIRTTISRMLEEFSRLKSRHVQSLFVRGEVDNTTQTMLDEWIEAVGITQPKSVHITTINKAPTNPRLEAVSEDDLYRIASLLKRKVETEIVVSV